MIQTDVCLSARIAVALLLSAIGSGCGGGSSNEAPEPFSTTLDAVAAVWRPAPPMITASVVTGEISEVILAEDGYIYLIENLPDEGSQFPFASRVLIGTASLSGDTLQADLGWLENPGLDPTVETVTGSATLTMVFTSNESLSGLVDYGDGTSTSFELARSEELNAAAVDSRLAGVWDGGAFNPSIGAFLGNPFLFGLEFDENGDVISGVLNDTCVLDIDVTPLVERASESSSTGTSVLHRISVRISDCAEAAEYFGSAFVIEIDSFGGRFLDMLWFNDTEQLQYTAIQPQT